LLQNLINWTQNELNKGILYYWFKGIYGIFSKFFKEMKRGDLYESFKG